MRTQGTTTERGYGHRHRRLRNDWQTVVDRGEAFCTAPVCVNPGGRWIAPGTPWDLGHADYDRAEYNGPEHARCNRGRPSRRRGFLSRMNRRQPPHSQPW
jgi:hypothetical protein